MNIDTSLNRLMVVNEIIQHISMWYSGESAKEPVVAVTRCKVLKPFNMLDEFTTFLTNKKLTQSVAKEHYEDIDDDEAFFNYLLQQECVEKVEEPDTVVPLIQVVTGHQTASICLDII